MVEDARFAAELAALRREVAVLRGQMETIRHGLGAHPGESLASLTGRVRRELDDAGSAAQQAMGNIPILYEGGVITRNGQSWQLLLLPPGASGTAQYRPVSDGHVEVKVALTWNSQPSGPVSLAGLPQELWPSVPYEDTHGGVTVSLTLNGIIQLAGAPAKLNGHYNIPLN